MTGFGQAVFLVGAGAVGGVATSAGGIATIIAYPALLAVGIAPLAANVTNGFAVVGTGVSSGLMSGPELAGTGPRLRRWAVFSMLGALVGGGLLLATPAGLFTWLVPFLVAAGALVLLFQPRLAARLRVDREPGPGGEVGLGGEPVLGGERVPGGEMGGGVRGGEARGGETGSGWRGSGRVSAGVFAVGVYNGYFGAASGIMMLALLMLTVESRLVRANALKNVLLAAGDIVAAVLFAVFGPVDWPAALALGLGFLIGGAIGPGLARRAPADALRIVIALAGMALAVGLLISAVRQR